MLIALFAGLFLAFGMHHTAAISPEFNTAETNIKKDVADPSRREQALKIVEQMKSDAQASLEKRKASVASIEKLISNRVVTSDELLAAVKPLSDEDVATRDTLLDLRFQLKGVLQKNEWAAVYPEPKAKE